MRTVHGYLDLMRDVPGAGPYRDVIAHADTMRLANGVDVQLINLDQLIRAKETANRDKDREVLHELRAVRATKRLTALGLPMTGDPAQLLPSAASSPTESSPDTPPPECARGGGP